MTSSSLAGILKTMYTPQTLHGSAVRLEPLALRHAADLLAAAADERIWDYMPIPLPKTINTINALIADAVDSTAKGLEVSYAIVEIATGKAVGSTRCYDFRIAHGAMEIGWTWLGKPWQRSSINTESKLLLLQFAFETLKLTRVQLKTDGRNSQSQKALERIGATREGTLRKHMKTWNGFVRDTVFYSILADEWPAVKQRLLGFLNTR